MPHNDAQIPKKDGDKNIYYVRVVPYINLPANQLRFNTPTGMLGTLNTNYGLWTPNWVKVNDSTLCTHFVIETKDNLEIAIDENLDAIYGDIPDSVLTATDMAIFLMFERKVKSPAVVSSIAPGFAMDKIGHLWAKFDFENTATPLSKEAPAGNFIFFATYVGAAGIADADDVFTDGNVTSSATHTFHFTEGQVGQTCYVHCFYQTKRGDRSPASVIISFVIV